MYGKKYLITPVLAALLSVACIYFERRHTFLLFLLPAVTWTISLLAPVTMSAREKFGEGLLWGTFFWALWLGMICLTYLAGPLLFLLKAYTFPVVGGVGGMLSLLIYKRLVVLRKPGRAALLSFAFGYLAFFTFLQLKPSADIFDEDLPFISYWQILVAIGHTIGVS